LASSSVKSSQYVRGEAMGGAAAPVGPAGAGGSGVPLTGANQGRWAMMF
jgi:hypothetical protein